MQLINSIRLNPTISMQLNLTQPNSDPVQTFETQPNLTRLIYRNLIKLN